MTLSFFPLSARKIDLPDAPARSAQHVLDEEREAAAEENRRAPGIAEGQLAHDERGRRDPREDAEREPRILDEEAGDLPGGGGEPFHSALPPRASGAALREIRTTAAAAAARKSAAIPAIARSSPGQWNPRPSPTQNAPNAESSTPTANLSVFSGIFASGRCTAQPTTTTSAQAASAPRLAGTSRPPAAPTASTMKTTSSPSSTTALNAVTSAIASHSRRGCRASAAHSLAKASASSCRATTPAARRIAFLS